MNRCTVRENYRHFPVVNPIRTASSIILPVLEFHNRRQIKPQSLFSRALQFLHHILPGNYPQLNSCSSLCFLCLTRDQFFSFALLLAAFGLAHNKKLPTLRTSRQKKNGPNAILKLFLRWMFRSLHYHNGSRTENALGKFHLIIDGWRFPSCSVHFSDRYDFPHSCCVLIT